MNPDIDNEYHFQIWLNLMALEYAKVEYEEARE